MKRVKWIFNPLMIWGAVLGWLIGIYAMNFVDTMGHKGPGVVHHGDGDRNLEWSEEVSESQHKRHNYLMNGFMVVLGLWLWNVVAKSARKDVAKANYLDAKITRLTAYQSAFEAAIGRSSSGDAAKLAITSTEYQAAKAAEERAAGALYVASKAADAPD